MIGSCLIQLAALAIMFEGPDSQANFSMSQAVSHSGDLSSFLLQFKTTQANTRIARVSDFGGEMFAVDIRSGYLQIIYNLNGTGNGTIHIDSHLVNTNEWFLLNISSKASDTLIRLTKSNQTVSCEVDSSTTINITLLGNGFQSLFRKAGMTIGGKFNHGFLKPFEGCLRTIKLGDHPVVLYNSSEENETNMYFTRHVTGISKGCSCPEHNLCSVKSGIYIWDHIMGSCVCKCSKDRQGVFCNTTVDSDDDDDDIDKELVYMVAGVTAGVLVFVGCLVCLCLYCKRTTSSMFGVYNPKSEEQIQGQQMNSTIQVPVPEKLI